MGLDDSKYLLQLARADVLTLPESPGDWNSVTVKPPKEGIILRLFTFLVKFFYLISLPTHTRVDGSTPGQDPYKRTTMTHNNTQHPSGASPAGTLSRTPQTSPHSPAAAQHLREKQTPQNTPSPQTRQNYSVPTPSEARRQVTGSKSPPPHKGRGGYRMALVSTIQPSFGTYPSEPSPKDEPMEDNPAGEVDR